ncbi:MAG: DUF1456 family protein [Desulfuromonadales bacterium]|nr:DUF1456 family protein [Desulfuromonadales bacterium]
MAKNELLRSIRDALNIDDAAMLQIFRHAGREVGQSTIAAFLTSENQDGYIPCSDPILGFFLDGLIILKRGQQEGQPVPAEKPVALLTNNAVLKKLRIALDLKEDDLVGILKLAGLTVSTHELTALFRKQGHKHYKECSDRFLNGFIKGLALRYKG